MKLNLAIQLINTWDFSPIEQETKILINGMTYPHTTKKQGYRIITKEIPSTFTLQIISKNFQQLQMQVSKLPKNKILLCEMAMSIPPINSTLLNTTVNTYVTLGRNHHQLQDDQIGQSTISLLNEQGENLEGRRFLIKNSIHQEQLILQDALDPSLTHYSITPLKNSYSATDTLLLPSFFTNNHQQIPILTPSAPLTILFQSPTQKTKLTLNPNPSSTH